MGLMIAGILLFMASSFGADCDKQIKKVMVPMAFDKEAGICFDEYFAKRDLAKYSLSELSGAVVEASDYMAFDDMILFTYALPMGEEGRLKIAREIYQTYLSSLKNSVGACSYKIFDGEKQLNVTDFQIGVREAEGQPGSRIILKSEDLKTPSWKLECPNENGQSVVAKSGNYFFLFVDVYENIGTSNLQGHLTQFLFSSRK